jgi:thioredoxin-related protein
MDWLQLEDTNDSLATAYNIKGIPHFIIIDKQGKVVDVFADRPSAQKKLITVLDREIVGNEK